MIIDKINLKLLEANGYSIIDTDVKIATKLMAAAVRSGVNNSIMVSFRSYYELFREHIISESLNLKRIDMPVVDPDDILKYIQDSKSNNMTSYDTNFPEILRNLDMTIELVSANTLRPTQNQIYLDKVIENYKKFGIPHGPQVGKNKTIIVSGDDYILDGHHRYAAVMLSNHYLEMQILRVPISIDDLINITNEFTDNNDIAKKE